MRTIGDLLPTPERSSTSGDLKITLTRLPTKFERKPINEVDARDREALKSLTRAIGSPLEAVFRDVWIKGESVESHIVGYESKGEITSEARQIVDELTCPAERADVAETLKAMALAMPSQNSDGIAAESWMELVWMVVKEFPKDIILKGLETRVQADRFRPAPADIRSECLFWNERRKALRRWCGET
jgi:hypothetical protein